MCQKILNAYFFFAVAFSRIYVFIRQGLQCSPTLNKSFIIYVGPFLFSSSYNIFSIFVGLFFPKQYHLYFSGNGWNLWRPRLWQPRIVLSRQLFYCLSRAKWQQRRSEALQHSSSSQTRGTEDIQHLNLKQRKEKNRRKKCKKETLERRISAKVTFVVLVGILNESFRHYDFLLPYF